MSEFDNCQNNRERMALGQQIEAEARASKSQARRARLITGLLLTVYLASVAGVTIYLLLTR